MTRTPLRRFTAVTATLVALGALAVALASAAGPAAAAGPAHAAAAGGAKVSLYKSSLGPILVNGSGRTLYAFTKDGRNKDRCVTTSGCSATWPVLTSKGKPHGGSGVKGSMLSTIKLPNGSRQVTYNGHPLYTYVADSGAAETDYVGAVQFGGTWLAVNGSGKTVK